MSENLKLIKHFLISTQILERRKKRDAQLEEKHRLEMEEEMTRQQQERDKLNDEIARKVEDSELKKNVQVFNYMLCLLHILILQDPYNKAILYAV